MPSRFAASLAFVTVIAACGGARGAAERPAPAAPPEREVAEAEEQPAVGAIFQSGAALVPRDDFHLVDGVLFSPDGRYLAVADMDATGALCTTGWRTTVWLYETETWRAIVVRPLGFSLREWGFAHDSSALVLSVEWPLSDENARLETIALTAGVTTPASPVPLVPPATSSSIGTLGATAAGSAVQVRHAEKRLRLGPPVAAVAVGGALASGEVFFAARWPDGSFALWDVEHSRRMAMAPPPPDRVSGVAVADDVLLLAGRDGSFWRYQPGRSGAFEGEPMRRTDAAILEAFDVRGFAGREQTEAMGLVGLLGGDPDAPPTSPRAPAFVTCLRASCRYRLDDDSTLRVFASDQPGEVSVWDGAESEPFGGDASTAFVCVDASRVVAPHHCSALSRRPRLFTQARLRSEARTRPAPR